MSKARIRCRVMSHNTGQPCEVCGERKDKVKIEEPKNSLHGLEAEYCWACTFPPEQRNRG